MEAIRRKNPVQSNPVKPNQASQTTFKMSAQHRGFAKNRTQVYGKCDPKVLATRKRSGRDFIWCEINFRMAEILLYAERRMSSTTLTPEEEAQLALDLGLGRAPGGTALEMYALQRDRTRNQSIDDFPQQLLELKAFLKASFPHDHPFARITITPAMPGMPELWLLGSSMWSASAAAQLGTPYAFAHFIDQQPTRAAVEYYRANFIASEDCPAPHAIVALGVMCAETEEEARRLNASARMLIRRIRLGGRGPVPTPEEALAELESTPDPLPNRPSEWPRYVVGDPGQIRLRLTAMAEQLQIDELMVVTITHSHQARMRSYELLAEAFELPRQ